MSLKNPFVLVSLFLAASCGQTPEEKLNQIDLTTPAKKISEVTYQDAIDCSGATGAFLDQIHENLDINADPAAKLFHEINNRSYIAAMEKRTQDRDAVIAQMFNRSKDFLALGPTEASLQILGTTCRAFASPESVKKFAEWNMK